MFLKIPHLRIFLNVWSESRRKQNINKKHHRMNKKGSRFNQTVTDPSACVQNSHSPVNTYSTTVYAAIYEAAGGVHTTVRCLGQEEKFTISVPSMSSSCPWLPSKVRDRKGAKSTKVSLSRGATFSKALSSFVVMLPKKTH